MKSSPSSKRRLSVTSQLHQMQSENLFEASLMPLFSQPSAPSKESTNREDSLLIQIRDDINKMVKIPTSSSNSGKRSYSSRMQLNVFNDSNKSQSQRLGRKGAISKEQTKKQMTKSKFTGQSQFEEDIHGEISTTTNRLFANQLVKDSLERILYLWSIRMKNSDGKKQQDDGFPSTLMFSNTSSTSRYMVCVN